MDRPKFPVRLQSARSQRLPRFTARATSAQFKVPLKSAPPPKRILSRDPHEALLRAGEECRGVKLSALEVQYLLTDEAILKRALAAREGTVQYVEPWEVRQ